MTAWFCLALALAFAGVGLLAIFRAPTLPLFFLAVGATEFGHLFALGAVGVAVGAPRDSAPGMAAHLVAVLAGLALLSPLARALWSSREMRRTLERGLGVRLRRPLIDFAKLWGFPVSHRAPAERIETAGPGVDFFRAAGPGAAPLVVVVHGGGWMAGDARELAGWNAWLAGRGFAVAAVDYRLVPTGTWPAQREDVLAAVGHLRANASQLGIDPERIAFLGRSAGGQIASALAATGEHAWLRGCVCLYSPFDMEFAYAHSSEDDLLRSRWLLRCFLGGTPAERPRQFLEASAYLCAGRKAPPFLLLHGGRDELVWVAQSVRFARRLEELGVAHAFLRLPWATHAFDYHLHGPGGQVTAACLEAFLRRVFGSKEA